MRLRDGILDSTRGSALSLQTKLFIGFGGMLLILLAVGGLSLQAVREYSRTVKELFAENYTSINAALQMRSLITDLDRELDVFLLRSAEARTDRVAELVSAFTAQLALLRTTLFLPEEIEATERIDLLWEEVSPRINDLLTAPDDRVLKEILIEEQLRPRTQQIALLTNIIYDVNMNSITLEDGRFLDRTTTISYALLLLITSGATLGAIFLFLVGRFIMTPVMALTESVKEIESGNLEHRVQIETDDELGQLGKAFNSMAEKLQRYREADEEKLTRAQEATQLAVDSLRDAVVVFDPQGRVEVANATARDLFGITVGQRCEELGRDWLTRLVKRVAETNVPLLPKGFDATIQQFAEGRELFFLPTAVPIQGRLGQLIGVTVVLADVTVLRRLDELKSGMVATVSHELKTPLTSIRLAVYMLEEERFGPLSDKQKDLLATARGDCERLFATIENLLDLSRIQAGSFQLEREPVAFERLLTESLDPLRDQFALSNIQLVIDVPDDLPPIDVDTRLASVVLTNLLTNALKYSGSGTTVTIRATDNDGECLEVSVADSGPGVPEEYHERIFERFFRIPGQQKKGAGLGLAIARDITTAHGGRILCENAPGGGTLFRATFPYVTNDSKACS